MSNLIKYSINPYLIDKNPPAHKPHYAEGWQRVQTSAKAFISNVAKGYAFAPQYRHGIRRGENFICSEILAADFDGTATLDDIRNRPYVNANASFIYTTASHTVEQHRARVVFFLDEPVEKVQDYADALLGLAEKLGSDLTVNDGARCFFGSSNAQVWQYPNFMSADEVRYLIKRGRERRKAKAHRAPMNSGQSLASDLVVKLLDGSTAQLSNLQPKTPVHCPYHDDQRASAITVRSLKSGSVGVHCKACGITYWQDEPDKYDFYGFDRLVEDRVNNPKKIPDPSTVFDEFFPAKPTCFVTQERFLKPFELRPGITLVKSAKGTGKTEALRNIVSDVLLQKNLDHLNRKDRPKTVLIIGHRRSLLREAAAKLEVAYYLNVDEILSQPQQSLAVCLDSLHRFTGSYACSGRLKGTREVPFDLIILDESEQLFAHSIGETLGKKQGAIDRAYDALKYQISKAKAVIALDADLSLLTAQVLRAFRPHDWDYDTRIFYNKPVVPKTNRKLQLFEREVDLRDDLLAALDRGDRCFVACNSKRTAKVIAEIVGKRFAGKIEMMIITSDNSGGSDQVDFLSNITNSFLNVQLLICSPSLGTGIDITFPDPEAVRKDDEENKEESGLCMVDCVYGFFSANVNTHTDMDQQLCRVRNPGAVKVWISPAPFQYSTDFDVIRDDLARARFVPRAVVGYSDDGHTTYEAEHPQLMIYSHVVAAQRSSKNRLIEAFCELRRRHGWDIERVGSSRKKDLDRAAAEKVLWETKAKGLLSAPVLDDDEYFDLDVRREAGSLEQPDQYTYERNTLERSLGVPLGYDIVKLNYDGRLLDRVAVLAAIRRHWDEFSEDVEWNLAQSKLPLFRLSKMREELLLCLITRIAGLSDAKGFDAEASVTADDLQAFADLCVTNRTLMEELLGSELRKDIRNNPVKQLNSFLRFCGMRLDKRGRCRVAGKPRRQYGFDRPVFSKMMGFAANFQSSGDLKEAWERMRQKGEWLPDADPLAP